MNASILNREFKHPTDGWYQIEAKGSHPNENAGIVQVIDDESMQTIVNRFNQSAAAGELRHGNEMLIDHEHFSDQPDQETRAYGWLQQLQKRDDGIYGRVRWTGTGQQAVDSGDYRFFSTEYDPKKLKILNSARKPAQVRPLELSGLSLTNMFNNRGQKPITNRGHDTPQFRPGAGSPTADNQNESKNMKSVCLLLGLSPEADEQSVLAAVTKLHNRGDIAAPDLVVLRDEHKNFKTNIETLQTEQVDGLLDLHLVKDDKVRNRLKPILNGLKNREERVATLIDFGFKPAEDKKETAAPKQRILNRGTQPAGQTAEGAGDEVKEKATAAKIHNRAVQLQKDTPTLTLASAYRMAQSEIESAS